jgi:hypothetical protein
VSIFSTTTEESVFNGLKNLFEKPKSGSQIDTGKMDRFIIRLDLVLSLTLCIFLREQASNPDDFWSNLMGNKWNERGEAFRFVYLIEFKVFNGKTALLN